MGRVSILRAKGGNAPLHFCVLAAGSSAPQDHGKIARFRSYLGHLENALSTTYPKSATVCKSREKIRVRGLIESNIRTTSEQCGRYSIRCASCTPTLSVVNLLA